MVRFIIIRHGYSQGNKEKRFSGQMDVPLDEAGLSQAKSTAEYILKNYEVDSIYSSDLVRAYETVKPIAEALGKKVVTCDGLREIDVGDWEGMPIVDVAEKYPESLAFYKQTPGLVRFEGGESFREATDRALRTMEKIAAENEGKTVIVGTHGGIVRALRVAWMGLPLSKMQEVPHVPNSSVTVVDYENGNATFVLEGYNDHLAEKASEVGFQ